MNLGVMCARLRGQRWGALEKTIGERWGMVHFAVVISHGSSSHGQSRTPKSHISWKRLSCASRAACASVCFAEMI